ncbi:acetoin reductase family protein [Dendrothele bispora CBS 962.96]|uniref:Acetoin reductase family protein n=1 Tax=Dendrothele bispora (strain CBS 962.96) TaxID=1314807 RepID=A0A4S8L8D5_DENBC|nr:acetoin reductase family protein [Dendrothele bispora CBS 962.96]
MSPSGPRVAIVTGSAHGMGRAIALRLADDGFDVGVNDVLSKKDLLLGLVEEIKAKGRKGCILPADISKEEEVAGMVETVVKELGSLDVMVANGAVFLSKPILEITMEDWDRVQTVNSRGTFLCYKHAAKQMIAQGRGGKIIGASSTVARQNEEGMSAYGASKGAIVQLTQAAAREWGPQGITVNCYAPGTVDTPMLRTLIADPSDPKLAVNFALKRLGKPEDITGIVSFLASKDADWVTGQNFGVNGGQFFS